jgi:PilZ domain-containing protein
MPTILIADEEGLFVALETTPVLRAGCRLVSIRSAGELVARASTVVPDLMLLDADIMGPGLLASLRSLKADRTLRAVPIVIAARDGGALERYLSPADVVFQKPVSPEEVGAALKRLLPVARRTSQRVRISLPVVCRIDGRRVILRTKDLGSGGIFLKTPRDLPCGTRFEAEFSLPDPVASGGAHAISAMCEVVRRVDPDEPDMIPGVGASFVSIAEPDARFLLRFVSAGSA